MTLKWSKQTHQVISNNLLLRHPIQSSRCCWQNRTETAQRDTCLRCWSQHQRIPPSLDSLFKKCLLVCLFVFFLTICFEEMSLLFKSFHSSTPNSSMAKCHCTLETARCPQPSCSNGTLTNKTYWEPPYFDPPELWANSYVAPYIQRLKTVVLWHFSATQANRAAPCALPFTQWPYHTEQRNTEWSLKTKGTQNALGSRRAVKGV